MFGDARTRDRILVGAACAIAVTGVVCSAATFPLHNWLAARAHLGHLFVPDLLLGMAWPIAGALIVVKQPRNRAAWLLLVTSFLGLYELLGHYAAVSALVRPLPGGTVSAWVSAWGFFPYFVCVPLLPVLFPDGRAPSRRWRIFAWVVAAIAGVVVFVSMIRPGGTDVSAAVVNPLGIQAVKPWLMWVGIGGALLTLFGGTLAGVACLVMRARRAEGRERSQLQWLMLGGLVLAGGLVGGAVPGEPAPVTDAAMGIGIVGLPVAIMVAMLRHQLFDVEAVLGRTVVYALLVAVVLGVYGLVVAGVGALGAGSFGGYALVGVAVVVVAAGHGMVTKAVDRLLFGHRRNPYAVVSRVGRQIAPAAEPVEALQRLVDTLRKALNLPYVGFTGPSATVSSGVSEAGCKCVPCMALGQQVGELCIGLRYPGERWLHQEWEAVAEVSARAATLAYAAGLVQDLTRSRSRIVAAREEERRRLRADLHDGLGPALAGTAHQLDALARRITHTDRPDCEAWARTAQGLRDRVKGSVGELRTVVQGLRPAVLDQLGLPAALAELVSGYETPECSHSVAPECSQLPAAVEVAAYRIAAEAVSNALRHSAAGKLRLHAEVQANTLLLMVQDNGCGIPARHRTGVGLRSMTERANEVGGSLELLPAPGGGTLVRATLPT
jgi:signal transduction histidine kinase